MNEAIESTVTLRALLGEPLADAAVRDMVVAAAHALAERHGLALRRIEAHPDRLVCTLPGERIVALGFAAELRASTNRWFARRHDGASLWGEAS